MIIFYLFRKVCSIYTNKYELSMVFQKFKNETAKKFKWVNVIHFSSRYL